MIPTRIFFQIHYSQTFDDLFIKWISQRLLCLVLRSFFGVQTFVFIQNYIDFLTSVSLYHHSFCPDIEFFVTGIKHQRHWRNKRTISLECTNYMGGPEEGHAPPEKNNLNFDLRKRHILQSLDRTQLIHTYFVALFSETRHSWFPSQSTKILDCPVLKTKIHDSYKFCNYDSWFMIPLPPMKLKPLQRKFLNRKDINLNNLQLKNEVLIWEGHYLSS